MTDFPMPNVSHDLTGRVALVTGASSGLGERFPPGFPVAEVVAINRATGGAFLDVDARPLAALDRGREVLLVTGVTAAPYVETAPVIEPEASVDIEAEATPAAVPAEEGEASADEEPPAENGPAGEGAS